MSKIFQLFFGCGSSAVERKERKKRKRKEEKMIDVHGKNLSLKKYFPPILLKNFLKYFCLFLHGRTPSCSPCPAHSWKWNETGFTGSLLSQKEMPSSGVHAAPHAREGNERRRSHASPLQRVEGAG